MFLLFEVKKTRRWNSQQQCFTLLQQKFSFLCDFRLFSIFFFFGKFIEDPQDASYEFGTTEVWPTVCTLDFLELGSSSNYFAANVIIFFYYFLFFIYCVLILCDHLSLRVCSYATMTSHNGTHLKTEEKNVKKKKKEP